jgi:hypothetical protein
MRKSITTPLIAKCAAAYRNCDVKGNAAVAIALYEINTWVWLSELSVKAGTSVDLSSVPSAEWDTIAKFGFDAVWFMGIWERSPVGIAIANQSKSLLGDFRQALPDFKPEDHVGSPYCLRRYVVDKHLGGPEGLAIARRELAKRGVKLLLDFVPNHVAPDHSLNIPSTSFAGLVSKNEAAIRKLELFSRTSEQRVIRNRWRATLV